MTAKERLERIKQYYSSIESLNPDLQEDLPWLITYAEVGVKLISYITDALISYSEKTGIDLERLIEEVVDEND